MPQLENAANLRRRYSDVDLIISCGDMPSHYLDFISTILGKPMLYVRGNHDERYGERPPGGIDLHNQVFNYRGLSFAGLEGCIRYNRGSIQYSQREMFQQVVGYAPRMAWHRLRRQRPVDFFIAHSPPRGIHDIEDDFPHRGFNAFLNYMNWYKPRYLLHGHVHTWDRRKAVRTTYNSTTVININPYTILDVEAI